MGLEAAIIEKDGREIVVVAVRRDVLDDAAIRDATLAVLRSAFGSRPIVLAASTSEGLRFVSETPEIAETVRRKRSPLSWHRYSFA
jgi:hypothetical protein